MTAQLEQTTKEHWLGLHSVRVVDQYGDGIPGVPVEGRYRFPDGAWLTADGITDLTGVAHLIGSAPSAPVELVVTSGRESSGPLTVDTTYLLIEA